MVTTFSFSELYMARISSLPSNSRLAIPSKHFLRWGVTLVGSFVSERISSISSLDKKKNLCRGGGTVVLKRVLDKKKILCRGGGTGVLHRVLDKKKNLCRGVVQGYRGYRGYRGTSSRVRQEEESV